MKSPKSSLHNYVVFSKLEHALEDKIKLQSLEDRVVDLEEVKEICERLGYWEQVYHLHKQIRIVDIQIDELKDEMYLSWSKRKFQKKLEKKHIDSLVIVHEYEPYASPPRIKVEIIPKHKEEQTSLAPPHVDIQESNGEDACEVQESEDDVVVDAPSDEMVEALEEVVEIPCVEGIKEMKEGVDTTCIEKEGVLNKECVGVVDEDPRLEVGLLVEKTEEHEYVKVDFGLEKSPTLEHVYLSRFVEFKPTKIRGRVFVKKGKVQQVNWNGGNTSKLINLVSLFTIWVWIIMQVRARTLILTCWLNLGYKCVFFLGLWAHQNGVRMFSSNLGMAQCVQQHV